MKAVFASNNLGKINEIHALTKSLDLELIPQSELGVSEIEETGLTFIENALLKARHASALTQLPALADDSGLIVRALQGAPVYIPHDMPEKMPTPKKISKNFFRD